MGNQESLQREGDIERMRRILIDIDGRTFQEVEYSPSKGVMGKNTGLFQEWHVIQCSWR